MKKLITVMTMLVAVGYSSFALTLNLDRHDGYFYKAGETTISTVSPDPYFNKIYQNYNSLATYSGGFQSFCVDRDLTLLGNPQQGVLVPSGISLGAAWLYSQFARGTLAGYNYVPGDMTREVSAWGLQHAIWALQLDSYDAVAAAPFLNLAIAQFGTIGAAQVDSNGQFGVSKIVLMHDNTYSQPFMALVPDGGVTVMLLGAGLIGLAALRRLT